MAKIDLIMPKMGESIIEATILKWLKKPGDAVSEDETILEIATDKVDSEIPSPVDGVLGEILYDEDAVVAVGTTIAYIETDQAAASATSSDAPAEASSPSPVKAEPAPAVAAAASSAAPVKTSSPAASEEAQPLPSNSALQANGSRFYSPLVRTIAQQENVSLQELESIPGSGLNNRVTKADLMAYLSSRGTNSAPATASAPAAFKHAQSTTQSAKTAAAPAAISAGAGEEIIEMDRMRKLIADHMVDSKRTSPHVTSMVEADVTHLVQWRNSNKNEYLKKYGEKLTFTPLLMEAVIQAIKDFPMINISMRDGKIIKKNYINLGMATALPSGNLIVPVIKNADHLNLHGLAHAVNDLASRARANKLKPEDIQGGTYTVTNVGTFGNVMGTPIINQPQVAILAMGAIRKRPAVLETEEGDVIAIRHMMFLSHSYDHRVVDGFLGGSFVRRVADYLEQFDPQRQI